MADPAPTTTNTKKPYYIAFATGSAFKFSGTKTIYTTEVITLLGITATVPANSKPFTGAASNFGISRVRVRYIKSGTIAADDAKYGVGTLLVAPAKLEEALKSLTTVKYKGKDITKGDKGDTGAQGIQGLKGDSAPLNHQHQIADVSGLQTALDSKSPTGHQHQIADVSGLQTALDSKPETHPGFVPGKYYSSIPFTGTTTVSCVPGAVYYTYFFIPFSQAFNRLAFNVTTTIATNAAVAIYKIASGLPAQLVDSGTLSITASSGIREISCSVFLPAGWYAIAFTCSPNTINLSCPNSSLNNILGFTSPLVSGLNGYRAILAYGNFPANASLVSLVDFTGPIFWLKAA